MDNYYIFFYPELRNESFALISFMGFPAILSALHSFQICIFNRKNSKLTFSNGSQLMGKSLWQICMHHWTVHAKVEFPRFPPDVRCVGFHSTTFYPELRNKFKKIFQSWGGGQDPHAILTSVRSGTETMVWSNVNALYTTGGSIPQLLILNSEMQVLHWYLLWGFLQY